jgi:hypothetical protein
MESNVELGIVPKPEIVSTKLDLFACHSVEVPTKAGVVATIPKQLLVCIFSWWDFCTHKQFLSFCRNKVYKDRRLKILLEYNEGSKPKLNFFFGEN